MLLKIISTFKYLIEGRNQSEMKVLKEYYIILNHRIDVDAFLSHKSAMRTLANSSRLSRIGQNTYKLLYEQNFVALDKTNNRKLIDHSAKLEVICAFNDIKVDAKELILLKKKANMMLISFLESNTKSFFNSINMSVQGFYRTDNNIKEIKLQEEDALRREIIDIKRAMDILTLEEMSPEERQIRSQWK